MHFDVTYNLTAKWAAQQIIEAFPYDTMPEYVIRDRDRDKIYGDVFSSRCKIMQIEEVLIAPKSPWQNPLAERVIGSIRRECLDHFIILNQKHFLKTIAEYVEYYNNCRTHLSLKKNSPIRREVADPEKGKIISIPEVGSFHHLYKGVA